ncbi:MAG TPA: outer membrane beta-barrel protein, partial [Puia sp.]|nr:outer membrane beta-barrel protein [Puia sp.]
SSAFTWQNSNRSSFLIDTSRQMDFDSLLNNGISNSSSFSKGYNWSSNALLRHRFAKKGRTLSANLQFGLNDNTGGGDLYSINKYYQQNIPTSIDTIDQRYDQSGHGNNYGASLVYTEPLSRTSLFEMHYNFYQGHTISDKKTFDADGAGKYTLANDQLTNDFANTYTYHREGIQFRNQQKLFNFAVGATIQQTLNDNRFGYLTRDTTLHQSFVNFLPNANGTYNFNSYRNLSLRYNTSTNQPSTIQLAPVADNSDPLNIRAGNPSLKQEYYHTLQLNYLSFDPFRHTSFFANFNANAIHDKIVNDNEVDSFGVRTTRPVNLDGLYNMSGHLSWGFPFRALKSKLNLNTRASYDHNASLENAVRNNGNTWTVSQQMNWSYSYKEILDVTGDVQVDYNDARYSLEPTQNQRYWTETYSLDFNWYGPHNFSIASDLNYIRRTGLPPGYNSSPLVWNAGLAKKLLKYQRGTFRLQVFDILKQNTGFSRNTSQNYIDDISYRVINRYWLLSFTYSLNRFPGGPKADVKFIR